MAAEPFIAPLIAIAEWRRRRPDETLGRQDRPAGRSFTDYDGLPRITAIAFKVRDMLAMQACYGTFSHRGSGSDRGCGVAVFEIRHKTVYRYARPVRFGEHRAMLRPRDSHDLRVLDSKLILSPSGDVRWMHDVFANSITLIRFQAPASELVIDSHVFVEHFPGSALESPIREFAETFPFTYPSDQIPDLGRTNECHYPDPDRHLFSWARQFLERHRPPYPTMDLLTDIMHAIKAQFHYETRHEEGTQPPMETLNRGIGTCRDYALFMMEAVRSLGLAARFVTGYLYDPKADGATDGTVGASATHAWVQIYLPGAGWVEFDPTNAIVGGNNLIRVGVARDPSQALPLRGTYEGTVEDFLGIDIDVKVRSVRIAA